MRPALFFPILIAILSVGATALLSFKKGPSDLASLGGFPKERIYWQDQIDIKGAEGAYQELKKEYVSRHFDAQHLAIHLFGEILYEKIGLEGLTVCDDTFAFGCYHGFFGLALADKGPGILNDLDRVCKKGDGLQFYTACQHGIGHGILEHLGHEKLEEALAYCGVLPQENPLFGCTSGVFMEYNMPLVITERGASMKFRELNPEDPYFPCPRMSAPGRRESCYHEIVQWWDKVFEKNYGKIGELCAGIKDGREAEACFRGAGNIAAPSSNYDPEEAKKRCLKMPTQNGRALCLEEAEKSFKEHWVEFREDGFTPREIVIRKDEEITFLNKSAHAFWPASNFHPTHTIYPEFDPRHPLAQGESWSFIFEKTGKWRYHDHLAPGFAGTITVLEVDNKKPASRDCRDLYGLTGQEKERCYDDLFSRELEKNNIKGTFKILKHLYQTDPHFVTGGCHQYTHKIGDKIYKNYAALILQRKFDKLDLPPETIYCGYGFYHGILEHSFRDHPDMELGKELCEYLDRNYGSTIPRIRLNCYHSLGHASIREPKDKMLWGNAQALVDPALKVCDTISPEQKETRECLQGAFNVLSDWIWRYEYGLAHHKDDPLDFCRRQENREHRLACFYEMAMHLPALVNDNLRDLAQFTRNLDDEESATVIHVAVAGILERAVIKENHRDFISGCRELPRPVEQECIEGVAGGLIAHGEPEEEYKKVLNFCGSPEMTQEEKKVCYRNAVHALKGIYTEDKMNMICRSMEAEYRSYCAEPHFFSPHQKLERIK